jgi:Ca-activated chloride channel homolog
MRTKTLFAALVSIMAAAVTVTAQDGFKFRSGVELVNVTATVTDDTGRFVSGLRKEDFTVYDNGAKQEVMYFSSERVPVSLGIVLDVSGSMTPDKMSYARAAIDRFIFDLLSPDDELFFMEFNTRGRITQQWTKDRRQISRAVSRANSSGGTAMYDAVSDALPLASAGENRKKALLVISDGNDADSEMSIAELRQQIRESEVLVYALGVDGTSRGSSRRTGGTVSPPPVQLPIPFPFPFPGGKRPAFPQVTGGIFGGRVTNAERVNEDALRQMTDDTGGRTEIVRGFDSLDAATARIADELSKQYYLGYANNGDKDGRWHTIRVELRDRRLNVRARRGYVAS